MRTLDVATIVKNCESELEQRFFRNAIYPLIQQGLVEYVEQGERYQLLEAEVYCGIKLPAAHYTPDFVVKLKDGGVTVVEVKHVNIRKLQRDYIYRRRLFIEKWCKPNGWDFQEWIAGKKPKGRKK